MCLASYAGSSSYSHNECVKHTHTQLSMLYRVAVFIYILRTSFTSNTAMAGYSVNFYVKTTVVLVGLYSQCSQFYKQVPHAISHINIYWYLCVSQTLGKMRWPYSYEFPLYSTRKVKIREAPAIFSNFWEWKAVNTQKNRYSSLHQYIGLKYLFLLSLYP